MIKIPAQFSNMLAKKGMILFGLIAAILSLIIGFMAVNAQALTNSMWDDNAKPAVLQDSDIASVELGVKFKTSVPGKITGIKFYKSQNNIGTHTGALWSSGGTKLASVTFTNETASGWQTALFSQPITVTPGTVYVASYHAPKGAYSVTENYFTQDVKNGPITMLGSTSSSKNGVYRYSSSVVFPNQSYKNSNYWVDVVFDDGIIPKNASITTFSATPSSIISSQETTLTWDVAVGQSCTIDNGVGAVTNQGNRKVKPTATTTYKLTCQGFNGGFAGNKTTEVIVGHHASISSFTASSSSIKPGEQSTLSWSVDKGQNCTINNSVGSVANSGSRNVNPSQTTNYTLTCQGLNGGNAATATAIVEVIVIKPTVTTSLWSNTDAPNLPSTTDDASAVELGVRFTSSQDGAVKAIKFYKGVNNTGVHVGNLWSSDGTNLASVHFMNETATGWQTAELDSPVNISAGVTYVVSYHAPNGGYAIDTNYFQFAHTSGILTAPQGGSGSGNGVFKYGNSAFPDGSWNASNYWVDVVVESKGDGNTNPNVPPTSGLIPWEGGPAYWSSYQKAAAADWTDPNFFPISVFFSKPQPSHVAALKDAGVNTYMAVEHSPEIFPVTNITDQGMFAMLHDEWTAEEVGDNPGVVSWFISDECEMGYGGCSGTEYEQLSQQQAMVAARKKLNDGRFLHANFGNGILRTFWSPNTMDDHVKLMDSASADKYTYTSPDVAGIIDGWHDAPDWPNGVPVARSYSYGWQADQMKRFQDPADPKPIWTFVETAQPYLGEPTAREILPDEIEGAVWSALIHEARGIAYFQHNNGSERCNSNYSIVECPQVHAKVKAINAKVKSLAAVLNSQSYYNKLETVNGMTYYRYTFNNGTDTMLKKHNGNAYVFAGIGMKQTTGQKTFVLPEGINGKSVEVVGENRTIPVVNDSFTDNFAHEYTHHVYKIAL